MGARRAGRVYHLPRWHGTPRLIEILHNMGILHRITTALSPEDRWLSELADITGRHHELADRLARHAGLCAYPNIAAGLVALAAREDEHARALDAILSARHVWSKLAASEGRRRLHN